jgi:hypothetical protein
MPHNKNILLTRLTGNSKQTTGYLIVHDIFKTHAQFVTVELPWINNKPFISCIPPGNYNAKMVLSSTFGWCIQILDVPSRSGILLHYGNYYTNTKGCILVGKSFSNINCDLQTDISNSRAAIKQLTSYFKPNQIFNITIQKVIVSIQG